jgi:hypothetical protein
MPSAPPRVVRLPPSGFADRPDKPEEPIEIGIRRVAEADTMQARAVAVQKAARMHGGEVLDQNDIWLETYNQALMHWLIAMAACQPGDVNAPMWEMAEDMVPRILSTGGTLRLFEEIESLMIDDSPLSPEIDSAGEGRLVAALADQRLTAGLSDRRGAYVRRLLARALEVCEGPAELQREPVGVVPSGWGGDDGGDTHGDGGGDE